MFDFWGASTLIHTPSQQVAVMHLKSWLPSAIKRQKEEEEDENYPKCIAAENFSLSYRDGQGGNMAGARDKDRDDYGDNESNKEARKKDKLAAQKSGKKDRGRSV